MKKLISALMISAVGSTLIANTALAADSPCAGLNGNWHASNQGGYQSVDVIILDGVYAEVDFVKTATRKDGADAAYKDCSVINNIPTENFLTSVPGLGDTTMTAQLINPTTIKYSAKLGDMYTIPTITMTQVKP